MDTLAKGFTCEDRSPSSEAVTHFPPASHGIAQPRGAAALTMQQAESAADPLAPAHAAAAAARWQEDVAEAETVKPARLQALEAALRSELRKRRTVYAGACRGMLSMNVVFDSS